MMVIIKQYIVWLFTIAINISITSRLWRVTYGGWHSGVIKNFWFYHNAYNYAKCINCGDFVNITNEATNKIETIRRTENYWYNEKGL